MRRSTERILTTHAGSLPRPENLTGLFVRRARGESVGTDEIAAAGLDALRAIIPKQAEAESTLATMASNSATSSSFISRNG